MRTLSVRQFHETKKASWWNEIEMFVCILILKDPKAWYDHYFHYVLEMDTAKPEVWALHWEKWAKKKKERKNVKSFDARELTRFHRE